MSELEPTITELEPTATERLRALLTERGVEWDADDEAMDDGSLSQVTYWYCNGIEWSADGRDEYLAFDAVQLLTPEQAIAATLGQEDTYTREDMEGAFVSGYSLGSLPVGSDPRWDENRQTVDEHMAELGWVRKEAATMGGSDDGISEMEWGSDEHLDGLSRDALKSEVRWWHGRALEMETENTKLIELVRYAYECAIHSDHATCDDCRRMNGYCILERRMRELGVDDG